VKPQDQVKEWQREAVKLKDVIGPQIFSAFSKYVEWLVGNFKPTDHQSFLGNS